MKKKSFVITFIVLFWIGYVSISLIQFASEVRKYSFQHIENKKSQVDFQLDNAAHFLVQDQIEALNDRLQKAYTLKQFNFYVLRSGDQVLGFANKNNQLHSINYDYKIFNEFRDTGSVVFKTIRIGDYKLTVGFNSDLSGFVIEELAAHRAAIARDILIVTSFLLALIFLVMKDILDLNRILVSGQRKNLDKIKIISKEGEVLLKTSLGYEEEHKQLLNLGQQLSESVGSAIAEEVRLGTQAPSTFMASLVRVDLNGYTQLFLERHEEYVTDILNQYFQRAHEVIQRYHGLIYQHIGDEIIVIVKDQPQIPSQKLACGLIRNLFDLADQIQEQVTKNFGHNFKIKTSFVYGKMRFVHLNRGYSFTGLPLIESVRMLSSVKEKHENSLVFYKDELAKIGPYCIVHSEQNVTFKGFENESTLSQVQNFCPLDLKKDFDQLAVYRSDKDIAQILNEVSLRFKASEMKDLLTIVKSLCAFKVYQTTSDVVENYKKLLRIALDIQSLTDEIHALRASILMLSISIIPMSSFDENLKDLFIEFTNVSDGRTAANAVEALGHFQPETDIFKLYFNSPINRLAANSLIIEGKKSVSPLIVKNIKKLLVSEKPFFIASGLYVISVLADHHYRHNYVYFRSSPELNELLRLVPAFSENENQVVRARAQKALELSTQLKVAS